MYVQALHALYLDMDAGQALHVGAVNPAFELLPAPGAVVSFLTAQGRQDPVISAYNRAYKTHYARIKYKTMTREEFLAWGEQARAFKDEVLAGEKTLEEFVAWARE